MPGDPLTLKASMVTSGANASSSPDSDKVVDVPAVFKWRVDPRLAMEVDGDALVVEKLPDAGRYALSVTAYDADGKGLVTAYYLVEVKDAPTLSLVIEEEESGAEVSTCKAGDNYLRFLLKGRDWNWIHSDGYTLSWEVKDLNSGDVYDDGTELLDLKPQKNGGIEAEAFGNYDWPAMLASFGTPGDYEVTATLATAAGKKLDASAILRVE